MTAAPSDGWTENIFAPGQHAVSDYPMDQRAALLWYHDHVMGVTRLTVYAGLAGPGGSRLGGGLRHAPVLLASDPPRPAAPAGGTSSTR